jgi:tetratricopeptide (TPR) repeat protein
MEQPIIEKNTCVSGLISEYEAMSQKGAVPFLEETAFLEIAHWYAENSLPDRALSTVNAALMHHKLSVDFHLFRAMLLIQNSHSSEACEAIKQIQSLAPDEKLITLYRAEAYCLRGDYATSFQLLSSLKSPMTPEKNTIVALRQARLFEQMEEYGKMYDVLAEIAIRQPDNEDVLEQIWMCVEINQNYADSRALHETVLDRNPYSHYAWHNLGFACLNLGDTDAALDAFEYAFITDPYFEAGYKEYGSLAFQKGFFKQALLAYLEMIEYLGEDSDAFVRIGECYAKLGEVSIALSMYEKALKLDPFNADAYFRTGECYAEGNNYNQAIKWVRQAIQHSKRREEFHALLAKMYGCVGKQEEALEHYWKAVEFAPEEQSYWINVTNQYLLRGEVEEALDTLEQAFENCIERNELLYCRAACHFLHGEKQVASRNLRKALKTAAAALEILFTLAPTLREHADVKKILATFNSK